MVVFECNFCLRVMKLQRGLAAHLRQSAYCQEMQKGKTESRSLDLDSKPKAKEQVPEEDQSNWRLKQQPAVNANAIWRPSKIRKLLGPFAMNRLLTSAEGDSKRLREALFELHTSKIDPKQQDQVYKALNLLLARADIEVKRDEMVNEEEDGDEQRVLWGEDQDYDKGGSDSEALEDDNSENELTEDELVEALGEEELREQEKEDENASTISGSMFNTQKQIC